MKLLLEKEKGLQRWAPGALPWLSCAPFVENSRAILIHRPRSVTTHQISKRYKPHIGMKCWCGTSFSGSKKFTFLDAPPEGKYLCARCEENAVAHGLQPSDELTGKHIHLGGLVAVQLCCAGKEAP